MSISLGNLLANMVVNELDPAGNSSHTKFNIKQRSLCYFKIVLCDVRKILRVYFRFPRRV